MSSKKKITTPKTTPELKAEPAGGIPTLEAVLGIEPAAQFQLAGRAFEARVVTLVELEAYNTAAQTESLDKQAVAITALLNDRLLVGDPLKADDVRVLGLDVVNRLVMLLQGQIRARSAEGEGKARK